ncbi:unnamed protein product [Rhizophagus irregularis]|uniref:Uncharacterized protein n=1 Tax=Rhizophagus irregularis TaxID=588596 RepID=A0A915ZE93_9GLOM|nr:unnamed protein product [Rhizophagus irregularis]
MCKGLRSEQISSYIKRTPAQFGGSRRIENIACELFPRFLGKSFSRKKLNFEEKRKLNRTLYAESVWQIDRSCNSVRSKTCSGYAEHGNICNECCYIRSDKRLCTNITKRVPSPENKDDVSNLLDICGMFVHTFSKYRYPSFLQL